MADEESGAKVEQVREDIHQLVVKAEKSETLQKLRHVSNIKRLKRIEKYLFDGNGRPSLQETVFDIQSTLKSISSDLVEFKAKVNASSTTTVIVKEWKWAVAVIIIPILCAATIAVMDHFWKR